MNKLLTSILIVLLLSGCSSVKAVFAMAKSTDHFVVLEQHPAIAYEKGADAMAVKVAPHLNAAIDLVETRQYGGFPDEVKVYLPNSIDSFSSYCASKAPSACVIGDRLFISPRLFEDDERISRILTHELSHLQMRQYLGWWNYQLKLPGWFAEGLAVFVAGGGGAEKIERSEAKRAIVSGRHFLPSGSGRLLFRETASRYDLRPHMFYRQ